MPDNTGPKEMSSKGMPPGIELQAQMRRTHVDIRATSVSLSPSPNHSPAKVVRTIEEPAGLDLASLHKDDARRIPRIVEERLFAVSGKHITGCDRAKEACRRILKEDLSPFSCKDMMEPRSTFAGSEVHSVGSVSKTKISASPRSPSPSTPRSLFLLRVLSGLN